MDELIRILLNLLFDNPLVALIAFGIVSFVVNKLRGAGAGQGNAPRRGGMPPFGGDGPLAPPARPDGGMSRGESAGRARPLEPAAAPPEPALAAARADAEPAPRPAAAPKRRPAAPAASAASARSPGVHARNAAQGMIWSEIYGPPRALRPHRATKR
jgi:hypothetical protein